MASFVAMQRNGTANRPETVLVRDEFAILALIFPFFWLLWHRLWFAAVIFLLVSVGLALVAEVYPAGLALAFANLTIGVFVALEGPAWRIARLRRRGYAEAGAVQANDLTEAEIRWFGRRARTLREDRAPAAADVSARNRSGGSDLFFDFGAEPGR